MRSQVPLDVVAGFTLAALAIPEVMGYTKIAGTPVVTGLYTLLVPMALFALFGSSRHLVVGADSATAAIMAAGLAGLAVTGSPQYISHSIYYANSRQLSEEIQDLARLGPTPVRWLCIDLSAADDVDFSAAATLREAGMELKARNIRLVFSNVIDHVRHELDVSGITDMIGEDAYYIDATEVLAAYRQ